MSHDFYAQGYRDGKLGYPPRTSGMNRAELAAYRNGYQDGKRNRG